MLCWISVIISALITNTIIMNEKPLEIETELKFKILQHSAQFHKMCSKLFSRNAKSLAEQFLV